jgi:hypothetical protein
MLLIAAFVVLARATVKHIDGIGCDAMEQVTYHVHAHLTMVVGGRISYPPAGVGIHYEHLCLYWLHTHDASGIIHIEAPHPILPSLGAFFDIWGQPLSPRQVAAFRITRGMSMRVYVDGTPYQGNPRDIRLRNHTAVTIELGPPFVPPPLPDFHGL